MSKQMKRVGLESSSYGVLEEPKARKHQILLQDYKELQKEADGIRHKLEDSNLRKLRLLAEVRFLRQRHKHLLQLKSLSPPKGSMEQVITCKKEAKLNKLPPLPGLKQNGRIQVAKVAAAKKTPDIHVNQKQKSGGGVELDRKSRVYNGKEVPARKGAPTYDMMKQNERLYIASNAISRSSSPAFDLSQENGHRGKEAALPTRAPVFDLNEISMGEEETEVNIDQVQFEEPKRSLIQNLNDDQHNDLKLLVCRNVGENTSQVGKRKISWQDPVALRV